MVKYECRKNNYVYKNMVSNICENKYITNDIRRWAIFDIIIVWILILVNLILYGGDKHVNFVGRTIRTI